LVIDAGYRGRVSETDETTDTIATTPTHRTEPDFKVRPVIEGDDPLAEGGWHSSGGMASKATVVDLEAAPRPGAITLDDVSPVPRGTVILNPPSNNEIEIVPAPGIPPARVLLLLAIAALIAFVIGRWSA